MVHRRLERNLRVLWKVKACRLCTLSSSALCLIMTDVSPSLVGTVASQVTVLY